MKVRIAALGLLVLGFAIRFVASAYARFTGDESHYWYVSRQLATLKTFPVYGPEITGSAAHLPGALYYYLKAIPQAFGASPRLGAIAVVAGHLAAAWLLFLLLEKARGERAALFGLFLAMLAPWDVLYSDRIWGSCVVPILGSFALYAAVAAKESPAWQTALIALNLLLPQLHLSSPVLWIACGTIVFLHRPKWRMKAVALGVAIAFVLYLPMLIAEIGSGFSNTRAILSHAGGKEPWSRALLIPLEMFGYAVLYGSAELSYHFDRGYWGGYDDLTRYATALGWKRWFDREGAEIAIATIISIALSLGLWIASTVDLFKRMRQRALGLEHVFFLGLLAGLAGGILLLVPSRKAYFPHYANVLMPMLLWPLALALDSAFRSKLRIPVLALLGASACIMSINLLRYYRNVDGLNGLAPTMAMVERALAEDRPIDLSFEHFNNGYAWSLIAKGAFERELRVQRGAPIRWRVRNGGRFLGDPPENGMRFGSVLVVREEHERPRPPDLVYRASESWRAIEVRGKTTCRASSAPECRYGDQPWQHMKPDAIQMRGRYEPLLFLHPISGERVVARMIVPSAKRGLLRYGLSDAAHASANQSPVSVTLRRGDSVLLEVKTDRERGLQTIPFALTSTGALELEIQTENDGARVFGFDLDLFE